ncbi:MAG: hypothetical protein NUV78_00820 [Candidatus Zambryskibacteria bacterium]|nr:hypothetical protein [Candidatus Zambryskibacteria bacterium]
MWAAVVAFVMAAPVVASAQTRGQAFTKGPVTQEEYARAIERNGRRVLIANVADMIEVAVKQGHVSASTTAQGLANYVRSLAVVPCPTGITASLAWVGPDGKIMLTGLDRPFRNNEQCLLNIQTGIWFASLLCGNFITDDGLPMPGSFEIVRPETGTDLVDQGRRAASELANDLDRQDRKRGSGPAWWHWDRKTGKALWIGVPATAIIAGVVVCSTTDLCRGDRIKQITIIGG